MASIGPSQVVAAPRADTVERDLPAYLAQFPGPLATYSDGTRTAAGVIRAAADYYGVSVRVLLAVHEASNQLLSRSDTPAAVLDRPISVAATAPIGFALQIDWAAAQVRAGMGPYTQAPVVRFSDGLTATINLDQAPVGVAIQRLFAQGRTKSEWVATVTAFVQAFRSLFNDELIKDAPMRTPVVAGFLQRPWQAGVRVRHLAYFDHQFPTVDSQADDDGVVVTYLGLNDVQYDGHDGHDYVFPDQLIGTPILAAADGVAFASTHRGNGVYIQHPDGYTTVYWHLDRFSKRFADIIDSGQGVSVRAGDVIGSSGRSGFVHGTPHLHFEVRRYGKQVDPYGWYGQGMDPCLRYAGCGTSTWLWSDSLRGEFDFTPPSMVAAIPPPPLSMVVSPRADMRFFASFDEQVSPELTTSPFARSGTVALLPGYRGNAIRMTPNASMALLNPSTAVSAGGVSAWVDTHTAETGRHYLFATSAAPDSAPIYAGTIALYYDVASDGSAAWVFWVVDDVGTRTELRYPNQNQAAGFQHVTATWHHEHARLTLAINGVLVATRDAVRMPTTVGESIEFGRFPNGPAAQLHLDEIIVWRGVPSLTDVWSVMNSADVPVIQYALQPTDTYVVVQLNVPAQTHDPVVMMRVVVDGHPSDPMPLVARFAAALPPVADDESERLIELVVELTTRSGALQRLVGVVMRNPPVATSVARIYR